VLYEPEYWLSAKEKFSGEFINGFISDPSLCRLYLGMPSWTARPPMS